MLQRLLAPLALDTFFHEYWERKPVHVGRPTPPWLSELPLLEDVESIITSGSLDRVRIVQTQGGLPVEMGPAPRDLETIYRSYADGWTLVLNGIHRHSSEVAKLAKQLGDGLSQEVAVNLYLTPPNAQGFAPHMDGHDVFVLQTCGRKRWRVFPPPVELPLEEHEVKVDPEQLGPCLIDAVLEPGGFVYIPRGFIHEGCTASESSLHLTIGVHPTRWVDVLKEAVQVAAERFVEFRRSVDMETLSSDKTARDLLHQLLHRMADCDVEHDALSRIRRRRVRSARSAPDGHFVSIDRARTLCLDSVVQVRAGLTSIVHVEKGRAGIEFGQNAVYGPAGIAPALHFIARMPRFGVRDLPDDLSDNSKLVLSRRLVHEGLLCVADGSSEPRPTTRKRNHERQQGSPTDPYHAQ